MKTESGSMITDYDTSEYTLNPQKNISIDECFKLGFYEFNNSCYENCPEETMISKIKKYHCDKICPKERLYEDMLTKECISNCSINDMFNQICKISHTNETDNIEVRKNLSTKIIEEILEGNLDDLLMKIVNDKTDYIINEDYALHQITSLNNQEGKNNLSSIDFGQCEDILRAVYQIKDEEEIIIYKIENTIEGFNIPIIEYVLFTQNGTINLNLSICNNVTAQYNIPTSINENEGYKYDPSSDFYNNECNKYSSDGNIDLTLYDRKY